MTLIGYWPLNEESGDTAYDHSGNENHGSLNGGVTQGATGLLGENSYSFDGSDDKIDAHALGSSNEITVCAWVYFRSFGGNDYIVNDYSGSGEWFLANINNTSGTFQFSVDDSNSKLVAQATKDLNLNEWHLIVGTYSADKGQCRAYVDGGNYGEDSGNLNEITWEDTVYIAGRGEDNNRQLEGKISEVRIYNRALTQSEIQYLYNVGKRGLQTTSKKSS